MELKINQVKIEIYIPEAYVAELRDSLTAIGACKIGNYDHVASYVDVKGYWKPLEHSNPYHGEKGEICFGSEVKLEVRCPMDLVQNAVGVIRKIHPYEEPVINILPLLNQMFDVN